MFDFDLPDIDPPGTVKLILHPHFSDLIRRDYLRVDGGFRWAINDRFEFTPEAQVYLTHGLGDTNDGYGVGEVRLGAKYVIPKWPTDGMETSLTLAASQPISGAPVDMTDGLNHLAPSFIIQHHSVHRPKWTTFSGAGFDLVDPSEVAGTPVRNQPLDDSMNFTVGAIYDLGQIKWTLTTTYATTAWIGHDTHNFFLSSAQRALVRAQETVLQFQDAMDPRPRRPRLLGSRRQRDQHLQPGARGNHVPPGHGKIRPTASRQ
ncbi:MAG: hypothetical protein WDM96_19460 [Lacunisphaera sp.]